MGEPRPVDPLQLLLVGKLVDTTLHVESMIRRPTWSDRAGHHERQQRGRPCVWASIRGRWTTLHCDKGNPREIKPQGTLSAP